MEFMREFPDDAACLDWLWRDRFAPDGHHAECPRCEKPTAVPPDQDAGVVHLRLLRPTRPPDEGDDLREVHHVAAPVVLRDVPHGEHSLRYLREAARARAWRDVQDGAAHDQQDSLRADERRGRRPAVRRGRSGRNLLGRQAPRTSMHAVPRRADIPRSPRPRSSAWSSAAAAFGCASSRRGAAPALSREVRAQHQPVVAVLHRRLAGLQAARATSSWATGSSTTRRACTWKASRTRTPSKGSSGNLKTGMRGAYKKVSPRYLQSYLDEYAWRYNQRHSRAPMFEALLKRAAS